jgi:chemotaxis protein MotA
MDWGSVAGLVIALAGILIGQSIEGGAMGALFQPAALVIVLLGTTGAVLLQSGIEVFIEGLRLARHVFIKPVDDYEVVRRDIGQWHAVLRSEGMRGLERHLAGARTPLIARGLRLVIDGIDAPIVRAILEREADAFEARRRLALKIWDAAGGTAPTIGILGAVLGLIHVMENLAEPARLGSGIAVAFVSTIYGVGLANLVFLPIANRLKTTVAREVLKLDMLTDVFVSLAQGESHWLIDDRLATYPR